MKGGVKMIYAGKSLEDGEWHIGYLTIEHDRYFITTTKKLADQLNLTNPMWDVQRGLYQIDPEHIMKWNGEQLNV